MVRRWDWDGWVLGFLGLRVTVGYCGGYDERHRRGGHFVRRRWSLGSGVVEGLFGAGAVVARLGR